MTRLSVNINKIALLRNARGRNYPDVTAFAARCLDLGADGITLHPRPDERHARFRDIAPLARLCRDHAAELNIEGYPAEAFLDAVEENSPDQCTLVPDAPAQLTSDHGWDLEHPDECLLPAIKRLKSAGIRVSLFVDHGMTRFDLAQSAGADRIELYTEPYARDWKRGHRPPILAQFEQATRMAQAAGLGVNAGHDLNLDNLPDFLTIPGILEVSIGHALVVECLEYGVQEVIRRYVEIVRRGAALPET